MCKLLCQLSETGFETAMQESQRTLHGNETVINIENVGQVEQAVIAVSHRGEICNLGGIVADVIAYLLSYESHGSKAIVYGQQFEMDHCRLLCLLFLIDWRNALLDNGFHETLTQDTWYRGVEGPYLRNLLRMVKDSGLMTEIFRYDFARPIRLVFSATKENDASVLVEEPLTDDQKEVIRHTVDAFRNTEMDRLIELVYATDPLIDVEMHKLIDIGTFATRHIRLYGQLEV